MITSFRMYNATPQAVAAWCALFAQVFRDVGLAIEIVAHKWPQPIETLWSDPALCCAFMCGWPYARSDVMQPIAAPVPSPLRYQGLSRYCSEFLAREECGWNRLEDAFGHRFGWMAENSQSGFNAPRAHLANFVGADRTALFSEASGPYGNPAKTLDALKSGRVDLVALDSFYLDLVRRDDSQRLAGIRTIATTPWTAMPLLVAAPSIDPVTVDRLREHLLQVHKDPAYGALLEATLLQRFVLPDVTEYAALERLAQEAIASGSFCGPAMEMRYRFS